MEIQVLKNIIYKILDKKEEARKDDFILYAYLCNELGIDLNAGLGEFLTRHLLFNAPNFETMARCRRKWQEKNPELVDKKTQQAREKEEEKYIELSKE